MYMYMNIKHLTTVQWLLWIVIVMASNRSDLMLEEIRNKLKHLDAKIIGQRARLDQLSIALREMDDRHLQIAEHQETLRLSLLSETDPTRIVKQQKERTNLSHATMNLWFHEDKLKQGIEECITSIQETLIKTAQTLLND